MVDIILEFLFLIWFHAICFISNLGGKLFISETESTVSGPCLLQKFFISFSIRAVGNQPTACQSFFAT